jgi:hypothetical protein
VEDDFQRLTKLTSTCFGAAIRLHQAISPTRDPQAPGREKTKQTQRNDYAMIDVSCY